MKVYAVADLDGLTEAMVAAGSVQEAADALGVSLRNLRKLGWERRKGAAAAVALKTPGRPVYRRRQGAAGDRWHADRATALASAARAALKAEARSRS